MVVIDGPPLKHFSKVAVFFPTLEVVVTEEFLIYDSNTILAAGALSGIFLLPRCQGCRGYHALSKMIEGHASFHPYCLKAGGIHQNC
jgi:hypothetical protein